MRTILMGDTLGESAKNATYLIYTWSLLIASAVVLAKYCGKGTASRQSSTDALTGFRILTATVIVLEHTGLRLLVNGASLFLLLSGGVISLTRRKEPGQLKAPFSSAKEVVTFIFLRWMRVVPLYWFCLAVYETDAAKVTHDDFDFLAPLRFVVQLPIQIVLLPWSNPHYFFFIEKMGQMGRWFVPVIVQLYFLFPAFELAIFGRTGQLSKNNLIKAIVWCCACKIVFFRFDSLGERRGPYTC